MTSWHSPHSTPRRSRRHSTSDAASYPTLESFLAAKLPEYRPYPSEQAFLDYHITGHIPSHAYENSEKPHGLDYLGSPTRYPTLLDTMTVSGETIQFRARYEPLIYSKHDDDGEIIRDSEGMAIRMTPEEVQAAGLLTEDEIIVAFNSAGEPIGLASDEWGTDGIWVTKPYQGHGIGVKLLRLHRKRFPSTRKIGQATNAGYNMAASYYRSIEKEKASLTDTWNKAHGVP